MHTACLSRYFNYISYSQLKNEGYDVDNIRVPVVKYNLYNIDEVKQYYNRINIHYHIEPILNLENVCG